ncbi:hypothetical protein FPZ24_06845 [Sphingomonas panacisoli]|uniref:Hydrolase n=1 Tax=Sphingomonas panacisoli TaxID=1813879 RepID=A0A5B8LHX5_9SPHN|nr:hypothetical protein [Sphingomonas panacisoli]QDZ07232.1 hypothetical protein FPZ24_06845 [Sphingomonas panacisoli]
MTKALLILLSLLTASAAVAQQRIVTPVDPLTMGTDDFARLADPALWDGLTVTRIEFRDDRAFWRLYRIDNARKPDGPLWFVPHDNENAAFQAAIYAVRAYGGQVIAVEEARSVDGPDSRMNGDVAFGKPIDPNRNFRDESPAYASEILAGLGQPPRLIVALHTNEPGYDAASSTCGPPPPAYTGKGEISVLLCSDLYMPRRSFYGDWPFDDTDSVAIVSYPGSGGPGDGFCVHGLADADMNIMLERVMTSDGSLSNFALFHRLPYVNLETQDRGVTPQGLGDARSRLLAMIGTVMDRCAPIDGLSLRPPRLAEPIRPTRRKRR